MARVSLEHVDVVFGGTKVALYDVSIDFAAQKATAVIGPNGAGKSTLLSLISGRLRPSKGMIRVPPPGPAYLGHELMLYEELTGMENLRFFARLYRDSFSEDNLKGVIDAVGLTEAAGVVMRAYSRGMKQRLAIARLLLSQSDLWLMDEPETGLDQQGMSWLEGLMRHHVSQGGTIIFSSHDRGFVARVADELVVLKNGVVIGRYSGPDEVQSAFSALQGGQK